MAMRQPSGTSWAWWLALGLAFVLLLALALIGITGANLAKTVDISNQCCNCYNNGRGTAEQINTAIVESFNIISSDPNNSVAIFASYFDTDAIWATSNFDIIGVDAITAFALAYAQNPGETNVTVVTHLTYWDPKTFTLSVERNWTATLTADRIFLNTTDPDNFQYSTYPAGTTYTQDDFVIYRFNCDFKIVWYREYFDTVQLGPSTWTDEYPTPCLQCLR